MFRAATFASAVFILLYLFGFINFSFRENKTRVLLQTPQHRTDKSSLNNLFLTQEQCAAAFPALTKEIDDRVTAGPFELDWSPDYQGSIQGRIKDGKVSK
jgi:hypothetical protein